MGLPDCRKLLEQVETRASRLGFNAFGVVSVSARPDLPDKLDHALKSGWHAGMHWMQETKQRRKDPRALWDQAKSVIVLGMSYAPTSDPLDDLEDKRAGNISVYARNRDYHELIKGRLKEIAGLLARQGNCQVKVFVDTAPVMEKPLAQSAGIGWQGKNTILTSRTHGAWLFLGEIFTDIELPVNVPHQQNCGTCTACLDICPTKAFPAPFRLDARKCLAYYNNEHHGPIPKQFRKKMGNRVFGCDDCLAVCPWNKFAKTTAEAKLLARDDLSSPSLQSLLQLEETEFRKKFAGSPVKRLGHARFLRNVLIAAGNSNDFSLEVPVSLRLCHPEPMVRGAAIWALRQLVGPKKFVQYQKSYRMREQDPDVLGEWHDDD